MRNSILCEKMHREAQKRKNAPNSGAHVGVIFWYQAGTNAKNGILLAVARSNAILLGVFLPRPVVAKNPFGKSP